MSIFNKNKTLNCKGQIVSLAEPKVMGILNLTPDSFYDGGKYHQGDQYLHQVEKMLNEGATFIDIGGMSSRPGAELIEIDEELARVIEPIEKIINQFPKSLISIDTVHSKVAKNAIDAGASLINDISAGQIDSLIWKVASQNNVPYILMHMKGLPNNMQLDLTYDDIIVEMLDFFIKKVDECRKAGIKDIIIDPGIGFSKSLSDNYKIIKSLHDWDMLEIPFLIGASRKSMIYKLIDIQPNDALNGTTAVNMLALLNGTSILRVHDVKEAVECVKILKTYQNS